MTAAWSWVREHPRASLLVAGVATALLLGSFALGRFLAPTRVETRTERVDVATSFASWDWTASSIWTQTAGPVHRTTTRRTAPARPAQSPVPGPDGTLVCPECPKVEEEEVVEDIGPVVTTNQGTVSGSGQAATETRHEERTEKIVERDGPRVMVGLTVGAGFNSGGIQPPSYGAIVTGRVLGPLTLGVQGEGNALGGSARGIVGLTF
ncbi:MAG: hypothetical protein RJA59_1829 [Pseudomonadota bacterium]|jgi:hypothetical protein